MKRCRAKKTTMVEAKVYFESNELECVQSARDHHVRSSSVTHILNSNGKESQLFFANVARQMDLFTFSHLKNVPLEIQHEIFDKFINHSLLKDVVPPSLIHLRVVKLKYHVLQNMKVGINNHLTCPRNFKLVMVKDIICTLASTQSISNKKVIAKVLGVDKFNISKTLLRCTQLDSKQDFFWLNHKRIIRCDKISKALRTLVID